MGFEKKIGKTDLENAEQYVGQMCVNTSSMELYSIDRICMIEEALDVYVVCTNLKNKTGHIYWMSTFKDNFRILDIGKMRDTAILSKELSEEFINSEHFIQFIIDNSNQYLKME